MNVRMTLPTTNAVVVAVALTVAVGSTWSSVCWGAPPTDDAGLAEADPLVRPWSMGPAISGFDRPVLVTHAGDGSGRSFVVEQGGLIRVVAGGVVAPKPFADLRAILSASGGEQGLLGLAFHPGFARNRRLFVAYTGPNGANTVAELRTDPAGATVVDVKPRVLLAIDDFAANHNGGHLLFGADGRLWVGTGDGGGGGDPKKTAQDDGSRLGKMLRIDVDAADPAAGVTVWGKGLRNPWRYAFDGASGDLWIADVGQNEWEEVNVVVGVVSPVPSAVVAADTGGHVEKAPTSGGQPRNFGWSRMEGRVCYGADTCKTAGLILPVFVYPHDRKNGCSITGGVVVDGRFLFSDYCSGRVWAIRRSSGGTRVAVVLESDRRVSSFGVDEAGQVWLVDHGGAIVPIRPAP